MRTLFLAASALALTTWAVPASAVQAEGRDAALSPTTLDRLEALTTLYRHARWFHPSDAAVASDWDAVLVDVTRDLLEASDDDQAAAVLRRHFDPLIEGESWSQSPFAPIGASDIAALAERPDRVRWMHKGVGESGGFYGSWRVAADDVGADDFATLALLPSLHLRMPLIASGEVDANPGERLESRRPETVEGDEAAIRLAAIIELWSTIETGFPYHDLNDADWSDLLRPTLEKAAVARAGDEMVTLLRSILETLEDGHANAAYGSRKTQVPLEVQRFDDRFIVTGKHEALKAIAIGEELTTIGGRPVAQVYAGLEALVSGSPQWKEAAALAQMLNLPEGGSLDLGFADGKTVRAFGVPMGDASRIVDAYRPEPLAEMGDGILYYDIGRIGFQDEEAAVERLRQAKAVVFDMRGYPRGSTRWIGDMKGRILRSALFQTGRITRPDWSTIAYEGEGWVLPPAPEPIDIPMAMLIDGRAISYAESVSGLFKGERLGPMIGSTTAGSNGNVTAVALPGGYRAAWTGMRVTNRDGSRHHVSGVVPDIEVRPTLAGVLAGRDEVLEAGLRELRKAL